MNTLHELSNLQDRVRYYEWLFEKSNKFNAENRYNLLKQARADLKNFKTIYEREYKADLSDLEKDFSFRNKYFMYFIADVYLSL